MIVLQEESTEAITRALNTIKIWNPEVLPKYALVDFDDEWEIVSLASTYPSIVFIYAVSIVNRLAMDG